MVVSCLCVRQMVHVGVGLNMLDTNVDSNVVDADPTCGLQHSPTQTTPKFPPFPFVKTLGAKSLLELHSFQVILLPPLP